MVPPIISERASALTLLRELAQSVRPFRPSPTATALVRGEGKIHVARFPPCARTVPSRRPRRVLRAPDDASFAWRTSASLTRRSRSPSALFAVTPHPALRSPQDKISRNLPSTLMTVHRTAGIRQWDFEKRIPLFRDHRLHCLHCAAGTPASNLAHASLDAVRDATWEISPRPRDVSAPSRKSGIGGDAHGRWNPITTRGPLDAPRLLQHPQHRLPILVSISGLRTWTSGFLGLGLRVKGSGVRVKGLRV